MKGLTTIVLLIVLCCGVAFSQTQVNEEYKRWRDKLTSTKAFLILPQDKYVPGDTVFFSAFFLTEDGFFVSGWQILRIAILDSDGKTIHRQLVYVNDGVGANQVILPQSIREGNYMIVAYNDYMKSFSKSFYFRKEIRVVRQNSLEPDIAAATPIVGVEGGHLVQGIATRIMIVATNSNTRTITVNTAQGREVASVALDGFGTANVPFVPQKGDQYFVTINNKRVPLPSVETDGCGLQLVTPVGDTLKASITFPTTSRWRNTELVAALTVNGRLYYSFPFKPAGSKNISLKLPTKDLPGGLALLSLIAGDGSALAMRHCFMPSRPLRCEIQVNTTSVAANEKLTSEISIADADGNPVETVFTVTATNESLFDQPGLVFPADINIASELTAFHNGKTSVEWHAAVDNYVATQPGNIDWPAIMSKNEPQLKGPPKYVSVFGQAYFAGTNQPIPDSSVVAGYMTRNRFAFEFKSGKNGALDLGFITLDGRDEMYYFVNSDGKELEKVKIRWTFDSLGFHANPWKPTDRPDKYASFMATRNAIDRSFNAFSNSGPVDIDASFDSALESDLSHTGTTINVQDYRVFPDMPELMREIIPRLYYRSNGKREIVRVVFSDAYIQPESSPLYIIDGVLTRSTSVFLSLNPADIITLKVIHDPAELSRFQPIAKNGIVIVKTKMRNGARNAERYTTFIDGINEIIPYPAPVQQGAGTRRKPDFRSTVYWNPEVRTDKSGKASVSFFLTDDIGKIKLRVRGLAGGQYFEFEKTIEVPAIK